MSAYKQLLVRQKGIQLVKIIYSISRGFPKDEQYGLTSQLRRAAVSIPSNIAEGNGRASRSEYLHFLSIARGSCYEVETQLIICREIGFCSEEELLPVFSLVDEIARILNGMLHKLSPTPSN